jgi:hypothetical protein
MCTAHMSLAGGDAQGDCALRRRSIGWVMCDTRRFVRGASGRYLPTSREVCLPQDGCQFFTSQLNCFPGHPHTMPVNIGTERGPSILPRLVRDVFSRNLANPVSSFHSPTQHECVCDFPAIFFASMCAPFLRSLPRFNAQPYKRSGVGGTGAPALSLCPPCIRRASTFLRRNFSSAMTIPYHGMIAFVSLTRDPGLSESCIVRERLFGFELGITRRWLQT